MVLYFSGTGNSRYVARKIAELSGDDVISINERLKNRDYNPIISEKPLVFVGPVYAGRLPRVMNDYIQKVKFYQTKQIYFVVTCAETAWQTVKYVKKLCREKTFLCSDFNRL